MKKIVLILLGLIAISGAMMLSGCNTLKYGACILRDNTSNPCQ